MPYDDNNKKSNEEKKVQPDQIPQAANENPHPNHSPSKSDFFKKIDEALNKHKERRDALTEIKNLFKTGKALATQLAEDATSISLKLK